ncbi:MAG: ABC transporter substrate-binding protein [Nitrosopumilus sp.]|nr:ABC transporter substrate-binding protein [Nitrosopumilus sp.]
MPLKIRVGHTPDADDAFMFYGIESGLVSTGEFQIEHVVEDIEKLNKKAINHELDITAVSAHAYAYLNEYVILNTGGSFGINYGPIIVSKKNHTIDKIKEGLIGIPGEMTSAYLLMSIAFGKLNCRQMLFSEIPNAVLHEDVDYGLIIHESQITFSDLSLNKIFDLGTWWNKKTSGLPVPLGINVGSTKHLRPLQIIEFDNILKNSIKYGLKNLDKAVDFSTKYGRNTSKNTLAKFIKMYVNDFTVDMKKDGRESISTLFHLAKLNGILDKMPEIRYSG